jgi:hypothetical protein
MEKFDEEEILTAEEALELIELKQSIDEFTEFMRQFRKRFNEVEL